MVIPLMKQAADEVGRDDHAELCYAAAWGPGMAHAAEARRDVRAVLAHATRCDRPAVQASRVTDAELVVSELISNVLRHAPGPCALTLRLTGTELSISMHDTSPDVPVVQPPDRRRVGGHGLYLVHSVSDRVVVTPRGRGKQITAHLRLVASDDTGRGESVDRTRPDERGIADSLGKGPHGVIHGPVDPRGRRSTRSGGDSTVTAHRSSVGPPL
ncbi:ATP-binding protein [Streptomyces sp. SLBN-8D4]|uniref:ATP-binding protein n=1 Tax=Streptomyces sp. SLBN-8D4 TaxID=3377728 RepID=UPI003C7A61D8